jgi:hypothetical protein
MSRRVLAVLAAVFAGVVLIVIATNAVLSVRNAGTAATDTSPSPDVSEAPSLSPSPTAPTPPLASSPLPADPCHVAAVIYCALNPAVTQATIAVTICVSGWTATVRPPSSYTSSLKVEQLAEFGYADQSPRDYEEDHRVPLELGGAPRDTSNLSPERGASPNPKDSAENSARADVCAGRVTLQQEQVAFVAQWLAPYPGYRR